MGQGTVVNFDDVLIFFQYHTHTPIHKVSPVYTILKCLKIYQMFYLYLKSWGNLIECVLTDAQLAKTTQRMQSGIF